MIPGWQSAVLLFFRTLSQILSAGISITAFSLLLYALTFNLKDRVARSFAFILCCVVITSTADAIGSSTTVSWQVSFWLQLQWVGIIFLPPAYLHFSDALLATTGRPSRGRRRWAVRLTYLFSALLLLGVPTGWLVGEAVIGQAPAAYLRRTFLTDLFVGYYLVIMALAAFNFVRAYQRTKTSASRRRMLYLLIGAIAPALGSFPFLLFNNAFSARHPLFFWVISSFVNLLLGGLVVLMAYAVAFFGVSWPDRVVKTRLFKWILRGPVTASVTLALVTVVRRAGEVLGATYTALVPLAMVGAILLMEYLITLFSPLWERVLFFGNDSADVELLHTLEDRLLTRNDMQQFLEMVLSAICDRLQAPGAYVAALSDGGLELVITTGRTPAIENEVTPVQLYQRVTRDERAGDLFQWNDDYIVPLLDVAGEEEPRLLGVLGISSVGRQTLDDEQLQALRVMADRLSLALRDRLTQQQVFRTLQTLTPQVDLIQRLRAAGRYEAIESIVTQETELPPGEMTQWVKDALTHYWGGPKLTESPLNQLQVVRDSLDRYNGSQTNALRAILREAIERVRPEGERRFTGEWILYNILEMKFLEGRKVREIALRLAMSEADLYRKQRVAVEEVVKMIVEMEAQARKQDVETFQMVDDSPAAFIERSNDE